MVEQTVKMPVNWGYMRLMRYHYNGKFLLSAGPLDRPMSVPVSSPHVYSLQASMATTSPPMENPIPAHGGMVMPNSKSARLWCPQRHGL